jgi:hypothetical protein
MYKVLSNHILWCHTTYVYSLEQKNIYISSEWLKECIAEKKLLSCNWKLNFLHNWSNYNKLNEWKKHNWFKTYAIVMYYQ